MYSGDYEPVPNPPTKPLLQPDPTPDKKTAPTPDDNESDGES
ncbi:hypothetical protein FHR38_000147 [Micromonospora polyrhachis]|uniref:Uncharacterized protein n=1 Tax=Micromonospora polyrhachis TaxID=1282883 RepID=A0A7W7SKD7_9ACTN|nr:hypothetical protein [Micromonospora polyrhachis]